MILLTPVVAESETPVVAESECSHSSRFSEEFLNLCVEFWS